MKRRAWILAQRTLAALAVPNYRRFFFGQGTSMMGSWMQRVAQGWLVLVLTGAPTEIGIVVGLQTLPVLLLGPYGGLVSDRVDRRRLLIGLQLGMSGLAAILGTLTVTGTVRLWHVYVLALALGVLNAFENPARQAFIHDMVGPDMLPNAVTLNSVLAHTARAVGPAVAGVTIAAVGVGPCFLVNALTFVAVVASLSRMNVGALVARSVVRRARGQLRQGFRYVRGRPDLAVQLAMMGLVGMLAMEFEVVLPVLATREFGGGARAYGFMTAAMGAGALVGGLVAAARSRIGLPALARAAGAMATFMLAAALAPTMFWALVALPFVGASTITLMARAMSTLQLAVAPQMRGRVIALHAVALLGSRPVGAPLVGFITEHGGPRLGLGVGVAACLAAMALGLVRSRRARRDVSSVEGQFPSRGTAEPSTLEATGHGPDLDRAAPRTARSG